MYLIVGDPADRWCHQVESELIRHGHPVLTSGDPLGAVSRFSLELGDRRTEGRFARSREIDEVQEVLQGVFVRAYVGPVPVPGQSPEDAAYLYAENQSATLAWLRAQTCPVVGSLHEDVWFRPGRAVLEWLGLLGQVGLRAPAAHLLSRPADVRRVRRAWQERGLYRPLSGEAVYPLATPAAWDEAERLCARFPVCLLEPTLGPLGTAVRVGGTVVWAGAVPPDRLAVEAGLHRLAARLCTDVLQLDMRQAEGEGAVCQTGHLTPQVEEFGAEELAWLGRAVVGRLLEARPKMSGEVGA